MVIHKIDNSLKNLGKTVLWQYDKAVRLLAILKHMQVLYHCAVEQFWAFWIEKVLAIDTCGGFGCSLWGRFLGIPRPIVKDASGNSHEIAASVYRRLLKGAFYLMKSGSDFADIQGYLEIVFGVDGKDSLSKWEPAEGNEYGCSEYGWKTNIDTLNGKYEANRKYPADYVFWYDPSNDGVGSNWICLETISPSLNSSFEALLQGHYIAATTKATTYSQTNETLLLELIDPENNVRKIGGAPSNALSISLSYEFGDTLITASVSRKRKSGVKVIDKGSMTIEYAKTPYYGELHSDQKALFEQKKNEVCPFPLGVGEGAFVENWVFGCSGDTQEDSYPWYLNVDTGKPLNTEQYEDGVGTKYGVFQNNFFRGPGPDGEIWIYEAKGMCYVYPRQDGNMGFGVVKKGKKYYDDVHLVCRLDADNKDGQDNARYEKGREYRKGDIFGYIDEEGQGFNYLCEANIPSSQNTSFETIQGKLKKTKDGDPFLGDIEDFSGLGQTSETSSFEFPVSQIDLKGLVDGDTSRIRTDTKWLPSYKMVPLGVPFLGRKNGVPTLWKKVIDNPVTISTKDYVARFAGIFGGSNLSIGILVTKQMVDTNYGCPSGKYGNYMDVFQIQEAIDDLTDNHWKEIGLVRVGYSEVNDGRQNSHNAAFASLKTKRITFI